jgi:hypothetical protein
MIYLFLNSFLDENLIKELICDFFKMVLNAELLALMAAASFFWLL